MDPPQIREVQCLRRILTYHPTAARPAHFPREDAMPLYDFLTLYFLAGLWMLLALPARWFRRIVQVALGVRS